MGTAPRRAPARHSRGQAWATTIENVGFNLNSVGQQAIAGMLPLGAVTLNAYAVRLLVVPITGVLQPVQQKLLIHFSSSDEDQGRRTALVTVLLGCVCGFLVGACGGAAIGIAAPFLSLEWQRLIGLHHYGLVVLVYGSYAGVVVANQALARFAFANDAGWTYAVVMLLAYTAGTGTNLLLLERFGLLSLPLTSFGAEFCATFLLLYRLTRRGEPRERSA